MAEKDIVRRAFQIQKTTDRVLVLLSGYYKKKFNKTKGFGKGKILDMIVRGDIDRLELDSALRVIIGSGK